MLTRILCLLLAALAAVPAAFATVEFREDFKDAKIALQRLILNGDWKISGGVMTSVNTGNDSVSFRFGAPEWRNFDLRFRLRRIALTGKDQHFGVRVRKTESEGAATYVQFYSRGDAISVLECVAGKTIRHEHLCSLPKGMGIGADSSWTDFKIAFSGGDAKISVNDAPVCAVRNIAPQAGAIEFYAYGVVVQIDDLNVRVTKTDSAARLWTSSSNVVSNSSFEACTQDGLADYWGCPHWGLSDPYFAARFDLWTECFGTDPTAAFDGKRSMRIVVPFDKTTPDNTGLCLRSVQVRTAANEDYVLTAHMKSDWPGAKVTMNGKEITLGTEWRRYSVAYRHDGKSPYRDMINIVPMLHGTYWIDAVQLEKGTTPTKYVPSIMDAVISAQTEDRPRQTAPKRVAAVAPAMGSARMGPAKSVVDIDRTSRMVTLNGKPFFPIACVQDGPLTTESLASFAGAGFNTVAIFADPANAANARKLLDDAHRSGLMVKIGFQARELEASRKFVIALKDHPALLAWDVFDEAFTGDWGKNHYELIARRCAELKEVDPAHPVYINENEWGLDYLLTKSLGFPGDIVSIDYYAYPPAGDVGLTGRYARHMNEIGKAASKPCWMYVLSGGYAFQASREPTPEELACSTYLAIVNGVTGIYCWAGHPRSKSVWQEMQQLAAEIDRLTPVFASAAPVAQARCSSPDIQMMTRKHDGDLYVIAVNASSEPVEASIALGPDSIASRKPRCRVLFEEREIQTREGAVKDHFAGHTRHIYRISQ